MMEEKSEGHMDTDVSSTTADVPETQEVTGSNGNVEMVIVVEQIKDEETDKSPKKPETPASSSDKPTLNTDKPQQEPAEKTPKKSISHKKSPLKDGPAEKIVLKLPSKSDPSGKPVIIIKSNQLTKPMPSIKIVPKETHDSSSKPQNHEENNQDKNNKSVIEEKPEQSIQGKEVIVEKSTDTSVTELPVSEKSNVNEKDEEDSNKQESMSSAPSSMEIGTDKEDSNDSHSDTHTDATEKEHNKSISRELKSLINSAKESKIISECTQLTSKTRKSRAGGESANTSLNTTAEADKIQGTRRGSTNSQKSNCSEKSEKITLKRSMRSQNPEFVTKVKQFLNSVTGKVQRTEIDQTISDDELDESKKKENLSDSTLLTPKKKATAEKVPAASGCKLTADLYCWRCHWTVDMATNEKAHPPMSCSVCPRSFHHKCLSGTERLKVNNEKNWVCPECLTILQAESSETRSIAMKKISLGMLCELLKHALDRMMELNGVEPFTQPVDRSAFPDYDKYVVHPMDLSIMKENLNEGLYGSTEAFVADVQWILHNSIIFNTLQSKLTAAARALIRSCRAEVGEIEACPQCYGAAHAHRPTWFTDVCSTPHILLWAKLKGFPYWPAKGMSVNSGGLVDVRFFGAHDRAWVPVKDCFLYSEKDPNNFRTKRQDIIDSMQEAEHHIRNISRKFGRYVYPPFKTVFDPTKLYEQLKMMIPSFEGEVRTHTKEKVTSPILRKSKSRSNSKSSKEPNEGDTSETEDLNLTSRKMADGAVIARMEEDSSTSEKDKTMEVDGQDVTGETLTSNKAEDSNQESTSRKRRRSDLEEAVITIIEPRTYEKRKKLENIEKEKADKEESLSNSKAEITETNPKENSTEKEKDNKTSDSNTNSKEKSANDESSGNSVKATNIQKQKVVIPNMFKVLPKTSTPKEKRASKKPAHRQKSSSSEKDKSGEDDYSRPRPNRSLNNSAKKTETDNKTPTNTNKATKGKPGTSNEVDLNKSGNSKGGAKGSKAKDKLHFDDDTSLAVIARKVARNTVVNNSVPGFPTISCVRSLSVPDKGKTIEVTVEPGPVTVGRVGVRAFARMASPPAAELVEIKVEPPDVEDDQAKKLQMMNAFQLQPINPLREVRPVKNAVEKAKARKTFPAPRRNDEGRSELNSKNSMVYIPIQPPATQAPQKQQRPNNTSNNGPLNSSLLVPRSSVSLVSSSSSNNQVNTMTTPLLQFPTSSMLGPASQAGPIIMPPGQGNMLGPGQGPILGPQGPMLGSGLPAAMLGSAQATPPTSVHTVPLITSVNGQWTFSLQPIMSVGVDSTDSPPLTNGMLDRPLPQLGPSTLPTLPTTLNATPLCTSQASSLSPAVTQSDSSLPLAGAVPPSMSMALVPPQSTVPNIQPSSITITPLPTATTSHVTATVSATVTNTSAGITSAVGEPPSLQPRPQISTPLDANIPIGAIPPPDSAGPVTAKLNHNAIKLADFFRTLLEDTIEKVDEPVSQITLLKKELETLKWKHAQEIQELKHTQELVRAEMRSSFEKERVRTVGEVRRASQIELESAVRKTKTKQWCANCFLEAQFYCCWNTSYCDYTCQRTHWPQHYASCAQKRLDGESRDGSLPPESRLQPQPEKSSNANAPALTVGGKVSQPRVLQPDQTNKGASIIVGMVDDPVGGKQTVKCVGTYKPNNTAGQQGSLLINKQIINSEDNPSKKLSSGGYLIVGGTNASLVSQPRRNNAPYF